MSESSEEEYIDLNVFEYEMFELNCEDILSSKSL